MTTEARELRLMKTPKPHRVMVSMPEDLLEMVKRDMERLKVQSVSLMICMLLDEHYED